MRFLEQLQRLGKNSGKLLALTHQQFKKKFYALREGENVLGISPTGTGKTLAYMLPLLLTVEKDRKSIVDYCSVSRISYANC